MKITITIDCGNAAFGENAGMLCAELQSVLSARALVKIAAMAYEAPKGRDPVALFDTNGNRVGQARAIGRAPEPDDD